MKKIVNDEVIKMALIHKWILVSLSLNSPSKRAGGEAMPCKYNW
jgi:hypothetical protein